MKSVITNAAEITVLAPIDNTLSTGGGPVSVGATVVQSPKGWPFSVIKISADNMVAKLGKPFHPKEGLKAEGLRHLFDASRSCNYVNTVRVLANDAKYPSQSLRLIKDRGAWVANTGYVVGDFVTIDAGANKIICQIPHTSSTTEPDFAALGENWAIYPGTPVENDSHTYSTSLACGADCVLSIYPKDGDPSINRSVAISDIKTDIKRFTIKFFDKDALGNEFLMYGKGFEVGINPEDVDDMGLPAYIEVVIDENTDFKCDFNDSLSWDDIQASLAAYAKSSFVGGTNGGVPEAADWKKAWDIFRNETYPVNLMFAAGNYDTEVLANCAEIASERHASFFYDVPPYMKSVAAAAWLTAAGLEGRQIAAYYCPFSASDSWYGGRAVWGASGEAAAACARGDAKYTGTIPGIHFSPAGTDRGRLKRTGIKPVFEDDVISRGDFVTSRINPVIAGQSGGAVIDDCLSTYYKKSYLRFIHVNRILNYIDARFLEAASYAKFEPDGLTRDKLTDLTSEILDDLVTSGALVAPRNPDVDGKNPYALTVEQSEIDLWLVTWDVCVTGCARRIAGQPRLIK